MPGARNRAGGDGFVGAGGGDDAGMAGLAGTEGARGGGRSGTGADMPSLLGDEQRDWGRSGGIGAAGAVVDGQGRWAGGGADGSGAGAGATGGRDGRDSAGGASEMYEAGMPGARNRAGGDGFGGAGGGDGAGMAGLAGADVVRGVGSSGTGTDMSAILDDEQLGLDTLSKMFDSDDNGVLLTSVGDERLGSIVRNERINGAEQRGFDWFQPANSGQRAALTARGQTQANLDDITVNNDFAVFDILDGMASVFASSSPFSSWAGSFPTAIQEKAAPVAGHLLRPFAAKPTFPDEVLSDGTDIEEHISRLRESGDLDDEEGVEQWLMGSWEDSPILPVEIPGVAPPSGELKPVQKDTGATAQIDVQTKGALQAADAATFASPPHPTAPGRANEREIISQEVAGVGGRNEGYPGLILPGVDQGAVDPLATPAAPAAVGGTRSSEEMDEFDTLMLDVDHFITSPFSSLPVEEHQQLAPGTAGLPAAIAYEKDSSSDSSKLYLDELGYLLVGIDQHMLSPFSSLPTEGSSRLGQPSADGQPGVTGRTGHSVGDNELSGVDGPRTVLDLRGDGTGKSTRRWSGAAGGEYSHDGTVGALGGDVKQRHAPHHYQWMDGGEETLASQAGGARDAFAAGADAFDALMVSADELMASPFSSLPTNERSQRTPAPVNAAGWRAALASTANGATGSAAEPDEFDNLIVGEGGILTASPFSSFPVGGEQPDAIPQPLAPTPVIGKWVAPGTSPRTQPLGHLDELDAFDQLFKDAETGSLIQPFQVRAKHVVAFTPSQSGQTDSCACHACGR